MGGKAANLHVWIGGLIRKKEGCLAIQGLPSVPIQSGIFARPPHEAAMAKLCGLPGPDTAGPWIPARSAESMV